MPASAVAAPVIGTTLVIDGAIVDGSTTRAHVGARVTLVATVTSSGADAATSVPLEVTVPASLRGAALESSPGTACSSQLAPVSCVIERLEPGATAAVRISGQLWRTGAVDIRASAALPGGDGNAIDDVAATTLSVLSQTTGSRCSILGTARRDVLVGTADADRICGLGGNDVLRGLAGADTLLGGLGNDVLLGGVDGDLLRGAAGRDVLRGGAGNDGLFGGPGNDVIRGEAGPDSLAGDAGDDLLVGGPDLDAFLGDAGNDRIEACDGIAEFILAGRGRDSGTIDSADTHYDLELRRSC
jgi:Ca2+-binding RTX toxin-like protein